MNPALKLQQNRARILELAREHGAARVRLFGSVARGEAKETSDLDLLVQFEPGRSLLDHAALLEDLEDLLGMRVDVVSEKALHPDLRDEILREAVPI
jgi:predicted nucleotidyltransferase